ncbi:MAG: cell division ATPase MinD [archaeon]|nr:cell division ATPase MinD [archaeon]
MGKVYVIISGKGGVGKTTSAINLGISVNELGKETIIIDANLTTPNVGLHLGSPIVPITLNHVMNNKAKVEEAIYEHESGTKIMPASLSIGELKNINHDRLPEITKKLKKMCDYVFVDSAAGLGDEAKSAIKSADKIVIITNPEISAVTDALKTIKLAEEMNKEVIGVIITRHQDKKWEMDIPTIKDMLEVPILGLVPEDDSIKESQRMKNSVIKTHPKSKSAKSYMRIARKILGPEFLKEENKKKAKEEKASREKAGFFNNLLKKIGLI